jgi:uncharacterized protein YukE
MAISGLLILKWIRINNSFALIKDVKSELSKEEEKINSELTRLQKTYNDKITHYQGQSQTMSQVESEKANRDILQLQDKIRTTKQDHGRQIPGPVYAQNAGCKIKSGRIPERVQPK